MKLISSSLYIFASIIYCGCSVPFHYTNEWAIEVPDGEEKARQIAEETGFTFVTKIYGHYFMLRHDKVVKRSTNSEINNHQSLFNNSNVVWLEQQKAKVRKKRDLVMKDPKWERMWYLHGGGKLDMKIGNAWDAGYTGFGIVVSILDDGIEKDHPDLKTNYDPKASFDVNSNDQDPQPRYERSNENRHGTRCAGEVAAEANNMFCCTGVAYRARIGGVRMLDGDVTDAVEAKSLSLNPDYIDIYSISWGPDDDGKTVDGPAKLAAKAFENGISNGRLGKGSIFVWASGNGGRYDDSCNCDGYTNSIFTLSISSATENGNIPWYSEACSSTLAATFSSGSSSERQIVTTDLRKGCTENHTGTSASAPLAAGICALTLEANPNLTWRDMQHIVVLTANPIGLLASDWIVNGVGRKVSHSFGYGLMDAAAMVDMARNWATVAEQHKCVIKAKIQHNGITTSNPLQVHLHSDGCINSEKNKVLYLEHVQAVISLTSQRRGTLQIFLTSPQGTKSTLLEKRVNDFVRTGFDNWAFMTTHNWGETSLGTWTLEIKNGDRSSAVLKSWSLVMHGTTTTHNVTERNNAAYTQGLCKDGTYFNSFECYDKCPEKHRAETIPVANIGLVGICYECDTLCKKCDEDKICIECVDVAVKINDTCHKCYTNCMKCLADGQSKCHFCSDSSTADLIDCSKKLLERNLFIIAGAIALTVFISIIAFIIFYKRKHG